MTFDEWMEKQGPFGTSTRMAWDYAEKQAIKRVLKIMKHRVKVSMAHRFVEAFHGAVLKEINEELEVKG